MTSDICKILVIDDSPEDRAEVRRLLLKGSDRRYQFSEAQTGSAGVLETLSALPDCVVLDHNLPDMDSPGVLAALVGGTGLTVCPVVVLTGGTDLKVGRAVLRAGAQDFLGKGWMTPESLTRAVENAAERWAMAREARASEAEFRTLFDMAGVGNSEVSIDSWQFVRANSRFCEMVGYTAEELLGGMTFLDVTHPDDRERNATQVSAFIVKRGRNFEIEKRYVRKNGEVIWVHHTSTVIRDANGIATRLLGSAIDITTRVHAEDQLRQNEQFNRSLMDGTADCVKVLDMGGRLLHMNTPGLSAMEIDDFGSVCGRAWQAIWPADARGDIERSMTKARGGEVSWFQAYCPTAKGMPKWWEVTVSPVCDAEDGQIVRLLAVCRDSTERKQVEDRLRASEARYRKLFEAMDEGYCVIEMIFDDAGRAADYRFLEINPAFEKHTGLIAAMGRTMREFVPDLEPRWFEMYGRVSLTGEPVRFVDEAKAMGRRFDGYAFRLGGEGSNKVAILFNDISAKWQAESALRTSEERFRSLVTATAQIVWTCAADGAIAEDSATWRAFTGQTVEQRLGWGWANAIHADDQQATVTIWQRALAMTSPVTAEYRLRRHDGEYHWMSVNVVPIMDEAGVLREWVGTNTDISERKRDEERLRQLAAELSESSHRKDEFLATLAHELRNPLAPIRTGLQLMKLAAGQQATIEQARSMMERQVTQMVRLVDDLMDVSRISRGTLELRKVPVPLATVLNSALETSLPLIEQMGQQVTVTLPEQALFVDADMTRLAQVFLNLVNNAAKYSERGGHIHLGVERHHGDAVVTVRDTGIGIAADQMPRIFDMFTQIDGSLGKAQGGLGIGLTLVKRLVEMHGGSVEASSEGSGKGSTFVVRLPVVAEPSRPNEPGDVEKRIAAPSQRILVVDDNRDGADSLSEMLRTIGNDTRTAYDGQEGVDMATEFRPDVVLLDIGLPKLNGYEACRHIRGQSWGTSVVMIAVTGWGQDEDRRRSHEAGFDIHLVKPVDPQVLMQLFADLQVSKP